MSENEERLRGFLVFLACYVIYAMLMMPLVVTYSVYIQPKPDYEVVFVPRPKDRPVLESVQQVIDARMTGTCVFRIGDELYVVENLPKHYVDYSSWYVRMP